MDPPNSYHLPVLQANNINSLIFSGCGRVDKIVIVNHITDIRQCLLQVCQQTQGNVFRHQDFWVTSCPDSMPSPATQLTQDMSSWSLFVESWSLSPVDSCLGGTCPVCPCHCPRENCWTKWRGGGDGKNSEEEGPRSLANMCVIFPASVLSDSDTSQISREGKKEELMELWTPYPFLSEQFCFCLL